ncbi:MAG TPA: helix-turn-helix transcriptional regulator [Candidatus Competibacteraceae bacterium]|nr:helix-turn-helix transcriptional regulator [Candidatus Competibacteraceae bacterium]
MDKAQAILPAQAPDQQTPGTNQISAYIAHIGERVRGLRARRGMTRKDLSKHSGISERYLAQVEGGEANISITLLWRIAQAMNVEFHELLPYNSKPAIQVAPLLAFLERLSPEQQKSAYSLLLKHFADAKGPVHGVALIGLRGAGKTTLGSLLAKEMSIPFLRLGEIIEKFAGMGVGEIFSLGGQQAYRRLEHQAVQHVIDNYDNVILEAGGSLVSEKETYDLLLTSFYTVWVRAQPEEHMSRVIAQGDFRPMAGNQEAMEDLRRILTEREPYYQAANYVLDTSGRSVEDCLQELVTKVRRYCCPWQWS